MRKYIAKPILRRLGSLVKTKHQLYGQQTSCCNSAIVSAVQSMTMLTMNQVIELENHFQLMLTPD